MSKLRLPALMKNFDELMKYVKDEAVKAGFDKSAVYKIILAAEEVITNVIKYAYPGTSGDIEVICDIIDKKGLTIKVIDQGDHFNPLSKETPDITIDVEDRPIGGLGIHLLRKIMDEVNYERKGEKNIITFTKYLNSEKDKTEKSSMKKSMKLKLKPKIMIILLCLSLLSLVIIAPINLFLLQGLFKETKKNIGIVVKDKNQESITKLVGFEAVIAGNLLKSIENEVAFIAESFNWNTKKQVIQTMGSIEKKMNYVLGFYFASKDGIMYTADTDYIQQDDYSPFTRDWYKDAIDTDEFNWTGVYTDAFTKELMITCSKRFYNRQGNAAGVIACDVPVKLISEKIINTRVETTGYTFLIDKKGTLLARPDNLSTPDLYDTILNASPGDELLKAGDENLHKIINIMIDIEKNKKKKKYDKYEVWDIQGHETKFVAYSEVIETGWILGIVINENDITEEVKKEIDGIKINTRKKIFSSLAVLFILLSILVIILSINLSDRIVNPIKSLVQGTDAISKGDLMYTIKVDTGDELELLANRFNQMAVNLKNYIENLQKMTADRKKIETEISILNSLQTEILPGLSDDTSKLPEKIESFDWLIPHMEKENYKKGEILFKKNDSANSIYYLDKGKLRFEEINIECTEKTLFGETGIFSPDNKRTATAVFLSDSLIYSMLNTQIKVLVNKYPKLLVDLITLSVKRSIANMSRSIEAKQVIENELKIASKIQRDMLPNIFPPFPDRKEFDIFASMNPAMNVGGDFYDFFFINEDKLAFVIADVSGKGIPASLFMVVSKTLIKTEAMRDQRPSEVLYRVNNLLVEENKEFMFVTVFLCILNVKTGELQYSNAGHNPPLFALSGNDFEYINLGKTKVIGIYEDYEFANETIYLKPCDKIFMYTDGVTEAMNIENKQFSEKRLIDDLRGMQDKPIEKIENKIKLKIEEFVDGALQSDDITMLVIKYNGD